MNKYVTLTLFVLLFFFSFAKTAVGQQPVTDDDVNEVARELFCPVCESTPLDVCPTQACVDWRELIRDKLEAGESPEEIQQYFVRQYGDHVLSRPPKSGFDGMVWWLPALSIVLGGVGFGFYLHHLKRAEPIVKKRKIEGDREPAAVDDDYIAQIEAELEGDE